MTDVRPVDLVIFDCDGVLIDSEIISARMLIAALSAKGVDIDLGYVAQHFLGRSYPTVMKTIRSEFGVDLSPSFEDEYRARLMAAFEKDLRIMPGVQGVLTSVGTRWCVATSSSAMRARRSLEIVGLDRLVGDRLYTAGDVANGKPAPDLFLHAAASMGVPPEGCLVIEDSLNGIRAARAARMAVWRFTGGSHLAGRDNAAPVDAAADLEFASFADFFQIAGDMVPKAG